MRGTILLLILVLSSVTVTGQSNNQSANATDTFTRASNLTTTKALANVFSQAHIPAGIITVGTCSEEITYNFDINSPSSVEAALNSIVSANPIYRWQFEEGVINVTPVTGTPALLDFTISQLDINASNVHSAVSQLLDNSEVKKEITVLKLDEGFTSLVIANDLSRPGSKPVIAPSYNLGRKNIKVREALNVIALLNGRGVWQYREVQCNGTTEFRISFLVV